MPGELHAVFQPSSIAENCDESLAAKGRMQQWWAKVKCPPVHTWHRRYEIFQEMNSAGFDYQFVDSGTGGNLRGTKKRNPGPDCVTEARVAVGRDEAYPEIWIPDQRCRDSKIREL
jgi:hypothetical protein